MYTCYFSSGSCYINPSEIIKYNYICQTLLTLIHGALIELLEGKETFPGIEKPPSK